MFSFWY